MASDETSNRQPANMKPSVHEPSAAVANSGWNNLYEADEAELALHWISAFNSACEHVRRSTIGGED